VATGTILRGWALARLGSHQEGIAELRRGLTVYGETGAQMERPYFLALLAEALGEAGQPVDGLAAIDAGLAMVPAGRSFFYEAELHRLRGVLLLQALDSPTTMAAAERRERAAMAETHLIRAVEIARRQGAQTLERRAVQSLEAIEHRA
jgi:predicted ATPase